MPGDHLWSQKAPHLPTLLNALVSGGSPPSKRPQALVPTALLTRAPCVVSPVGRVTRKTPARDVRRGKQESSTQSSVFWNVPRELHRPHPRLGICCLPRRNVHTGQPGGNKTVSPVPESTQSLRDLSQMLRTSDGRWQSMSPAGTLSHHPHRHGDTWALSCGF